MSVMFRAPKWRRQSMVLDLYNLVFAVFLLVSPWLFSYVRESARIDTWASGGAVAVLAIAAIITYANWKEWLNLLLGAWLIVSPWVLGFTHTWAMHVCIGVGIAVALVAATELGFVEGGGDTARPA